MKHTAATVLDPKPVAQPHRRWRRGPALGLLLVLLLVAGCGSNDPTLLPTPDVNVLAPTATALTARVEVVVAIVTPTAEPTPTAAPAAASHGDAAASDSDQSSSSDGGSEQAAASSGGGQAAEMTNQELINRGETVFVDNCASCHGQNGQGVDSYPALDGSSVLTASDPASALQTVLHGRGEMPAFEDDLSNKQLAAVLSYARNSWSNDAAVVKVAHVRELRSGSADSASASGESEAAAGGDGSNEEQAQAMVTVAPEEEVTSTATPTEEATSTPEFGAATAAAEEASSPAPDEESAIPTASPAPAEEATPTLAAAPESAPPAMWTPSRQVTPLLPATPPPTEEATATPPTENSSDSDSSQDSSQDFLTQGEAIYDNECSSCHQPDGLGTMFYPALSGSDRLTAENPTEAIQYVLNGRGEMPAFGDTLTNWEIAAVLSFTRQAWDNQADPIDAEAVEQVRNDSAE